MPQTAPEVPAQALREALAPYAVHGLVEWTADGRPRLIPLLEPAAHGSDDETLDLALSTTRSEAVGSDPAEPGGGCPLLHLHGDAAQALGGARLAQIERRLAPDGALTAWIDAAPGSPESREAEAALRGSPAFRLREMRALGDGCWIAARRVSSTLRIGLFPDAPGACLQIRTLGPLETLESRGRVELCLLPRTVDTVQVARLDLLLLQRFGGLPAARLLLEARRLGVPAALELDDDFFNLPWFNPAAESFGRFEARTLLRAVLRGVNSVVTSTPHLQQQMREHNPDVRTLHNLVDTALFKPHPAEPEDQVTTFGYIGTKTHEEDFRPLLEPLRELLEQMSDRVRAVFIGHVPDELRRLANVRYLGWFATYQNAAAALSRSGANVALAPLMDLEFNRSKSAMKYLEYGAAGIPGIFSDVDAYRPFIRHGDNGLLVSGHHADAWRQALRYVVEHPQHRQRMAESAYLEVRDHHSIERRAEDFFALYRGIVEDATATRATTPVAPSPAPASPGLTVILRLREGVETALPTLAAFVGELPRETQWIVVPDDDEMAELLELAAAVQVVRAPDDGTTPGHGIGRALDLSLAERVLVLDSSLRPGGELAPALIRVAVEHRVAAVGPRTSVASSPQGARALVGSGPGQGTEVAEALQAAAHEQPLTPVRTLAPQCVLLDRAAVQAVGGIAEDELVWDDALTDLCRRLHEAGRSVAVANGIHVESLPRQAPALSLDRRRRSRRCLLERSPAKSWRAPGDDPLCWFGGADEQLDLWIWSRTDSPYLDECLQRIGRWSDVPLRAHVLHHPDDEGAPQRAQQRGATAHALAPGQSAMEPIVTCRHSTHAVFLHDGIMVTPGWLTEMLGLMLERGLAVVAPFANDGCPEQRFAIDRGLTMARLDELIQERVATRQDRGRPAKRVAGWCLLLDLAQRPAGLGTEPGTPETWARSEAERRLAVAGRAYVHVLSHPAEAAGAGFGPWPGGPLDHEPPGVAELVRLGERLQDTVEFVTRMRPLLAGLRANPVDGRLLAGMGLLYLGRGDLQQAMSVLDRARRLDPFSPEVREALRHAREVLDRGPIPA